MNILQALDQLVMGKVSMAEEINSCLREKDYDLRHEIVEIQSMPSRQKQLADMKNILAVSERILACLKASQYNQAECSWELAEDDLYDFIFNLKNLMVRYQREFGKKNEWVYEAA